MTAHSRLPRRPAPASATLTRPSYKERLVFLGENGSGKSTLARELLASGYRYLVLDIKHDFPAIPEHSGGALGGDAVITDPEHEFFTGRRGGFLSGGPGGTPFSWSRGASSSADSAGAYRPPSDLPARIIFRPGPEHNTDSWLAYWLRWAYFRGQSVGHRQPFVIYIDEALYIAESGRRAAAWLSHLAVAGRSLNIGLWAASQRPRWIPRSVFTEAWRWYIFHLGYSEDEEEVVRFMKVGTSRAARAQAVEYLQAATQNYAFIEMRRHPGMAGKKLIRRMPPVRLTEP